MSAIKTGLLAVAVTAALFASIPGKARAQDLATVTLKSFDGFTQLRGKLVEFNGSVYTIETVIGVIQVDALQVNCEGEACPEDILFGAEFGIHGSNTIGAELMPALIEGYADALGAELVIEVGQGSMERTARIVHLDGREMAAIDLQSKGSSSAFRGLGGKAAEIGMSSRRMRDRDLPELFGAGINDLRDTPNEHVIGLDGLIMIVHASNPVKSLTLEELALIYSGTITNWAQLGGRDAPIKLYALEDSSGTFQTFGSLVLAPYDVDIDPRAERFASNIRLSDSVAADPDGIGITAAAYQRSTKALPVRQECGILSYPSTFGMKAEEYPLSRRLYLYTPGDDVAAHARQLITFAKSEAAQPLIAEAGFVDQSIETLSINDQGARIIHALLDEAEVPFSTFREMLTQLRTAQRISITFRFTPGSSQLTPKSQLDLVRLTESLAAGAFGDKEVLLVGFTDSVRQFALNRGLSLRRAQVVETELQNAVAPGALDGVQVTSLGYGELLPVGCNTSLQGRSANRRVEVWVRDRS